MRPKARETTALITFGQWKLFNISFNKSFNKASISSINKLHLIVGIWQISDILYWLKVFIVALAQQK